MNSQDLNYLYKLISSDSIKSDDIFEHKQYIKKKMRDIYFNNYPLSNINNKYIYNNIFSYNYDYQRFDSNILYKDFAKVFYGISDYSSKTFFTNCGMSAISSLLLAINITGKYKINYEKDIYFETKQIIKQFYKKTFFKKKIYFFLKKK